jgi:predicted nucleic-acid-binding Zn-ribbon protein
MKHCPKCNDVMEEGFVLETRWYRLAPNIWIAGKPEKSFLRGKRVGNARKAVVTTYRCANCGYLESYAEKVTTEGVFDGD